MKKLLLAAAIVSLSVAPAVAKTFTTKFVQPDGTTVTVTFDDVAMTTVNDRGEQGTYTFDPATLKLCGKIPSQDYCITFASKGLEKPGDTVGYTQADGKAGTATLVSSQ
jgi:hypothetical protein